MCWINRSITMTQRKLCPFEGIWRRRREIKLFSIWPNLPSFRTSLKCQKCFRQNENSIEVTGVSHCGAVMLKKKGSPHWILLLTWILRKIKIKPAPCKCDKGYTAHPGGCFLLWWTSDTEKVPCYSMQKFIHFYVYLHEQRWSRDKERSHFYSQEHRWGFRGGYQACQEVSGGVYR